MARKTSNRNLSRRAGGVGRRLQAGWLAVRGGVEPPTFRFSGGFAGPGESTTGRLGSPNDALALLRSEDQRHVCTAFVDAAVARSACRQAGYRRRDSPAKTCGGLGRSRTSPTTPFRPVFCTSCGRVRADSLQAMRRTGQVAGAAVLLLGVFWAGRETAHGLGAFWDHWWCPIPLALILLGLAALLVTRRPSPTA